LLNSFDPSFNFVGPVGAPALDKSGGVYGVTQGGGLCCGIVFKLTPSGSSYTYTVVYEFPGGTGGYLPQAGVTTDSHGAVYGTTYYGGNSNCSGGCGLVFKITPTRTGIPRSRDLSISEHCGRK
jgi:uncharacterized repeat protein (TIGR03803 family)